MLLIGTISIVFGALGYGLAARARRTATNAMNGVVPAEVTASDLFATIVDQETGERGYVITAEASFLAPYLRGALDTPSLEKSLAHELAGHPRALSRLHEVEGRYDAWFADFAAPQVRAVSVGLTAQAINEEKTGVGKHLFDAVRRSLTALDDQIGVDERRATGELRSLENETLGIIVATTVCVLVAAALSLVLLWRWLIRPIRRLEAEVAVVAGGDVTHAVAAAGAPEIASLGHNVERMRRRLREESEEARQLRGALAVRSPLQAELRAQLAVDGEASFAGLRYAGRVVPAEGVLAGDWYDVITRGDDAFVALGDVSGHGAPSGLLALRTKLTLAAVLEATEDPGAALGALAHHLGELDGAFVTLALVHVNVATGRARYASAGHPDALLLRGGEQIGLPATGPLLGLLPGPWRTVDLDVADGDLLLLLTDGVLEARRSDGALLGEDGLASVLEQAGVHGEPAELLDRIFSALALEAPGPAFDDVTMVVCRFGA